MRLLLFNLATDAADPILGFTSRWIASLAARVESVDVITMRAGLVDLPGNVRVYSIGKERGYTRGRRAAMFYRHLTHILRQHRVDVAFSHMAPIFTVMAGPVLRPRGIPVVTWYAHRQLTATLRLAHHLSSRMVSINPASYPYRHDKLTCIGHGIDTTLFEPAEVAPAGPPLLLSVGRLSPIKDPLTLVRAVALLRERGHDVRCALVGDAPERDRAFARQLREDVRAMGLDGVVHFTGALPYEAVGHWYRRCFAHVNGSPADHALDKAGLEAMACAKPSLSSTLAFRETMGHRADHLIFRHGDPADLADKLMALLAFSPAELAGIGRELRARLVEMHDLEGVADKLLAVFAGAITPGRGGDGA